MRGKNKLSLSRIGLRIRKERNKLLYQRGMQAPIKLVDKQDAPIRKHLKRSREQLERAHSPIGLVGKVKLVCPIGPRMVEDKLEMIAGIRTVTHEDRLQRTMRIIISRVIFLRHPTQLNALDSKISKRYKCRHALKVDGRKAVQHRGATEKARVELTSLENSQNIVSQTNVRICQALYFANSTRHGEEERVFGSDRPSLLFRALERGTKSYDLFTLIICFAKKELGWLLRIVGNKLFLKNRLRL